MMKKVTILLTLTISLVVSAQKTKNINIVWKEKQIHTPNTQITVPGFDDTYFDYSEDQGLFYVIQWPETAEINQSSVKINNVVYESISAKDLGGLSLDLIPTQPKYLVRTITARNKKSGFARFSPIIKEGNGYKRIKSLDITYQTGGVKSLRSKMMPTNSVLASGDWFQFYVNRTGVFRITPDFLRNLGIPLSSVDPNTLKIYGNGGRMLPLLNQETTSIDLVENAIQVVGGEDGVLSGNDYILFYGEGTTGYSEENETNLNLYADKSYYYITYGGGNGKRITNYVEPSGAATVQIDSFTDYQFYEVDEENIGKLGRRWFGDSFDFENNRSYNFTFPNLITSEPLELKVLAAAVSSSNSTFTITVNGATEDNINLANVSGLLVGREGRVQKPITVSSDEITIGLSYNNSGNPSARAYLDYISLKGKRRLSGTGSQMPFFYEESATSTGIGAYTITNASGISQVWDVTNRNSIASLANSNNASTISFKANLGEARNYIAVVPDDYYDPPSDPKGRIANQDIKGTVFLNSQGQFEDIDYLLIAKEEYLQAANKLAQHHKNVNNLTVKILLLEQIYREFGSGKQDIAAIRNAIKYVYDNASDPSKRVRYLCMFGDASVDYKNRLRDNNNIVPTFQSLSSFSTLSSSASDDFFGCMDPEEGRVTSSDQLDIAVGRILMDTPQLADAMVNKIISYSDQQSYGRWRSTLLLVADDVDRAGPSQNPRLSWEGVIQQNLNDLGDDLVAKKPFFNLSKIYADSYEQETTSSGNRYPKVNEAFSNAIEKGALLINYFGHGGEDGLAKEFIFNKSDAKNLVNPNKFPVFVTVTCEYTKFDNPLRFTAGEIMYQNIEGGAIGLITTTRSIDVTTGININESLSEFLFPDGAEYPSVAESLRQTKNSILTNNRRVVFYIGDPALKLAIPKPNIRLTKVNEIPVDQGIEQIKALDKVKISGEVTDLSGTLLSSYNGVLSTTIYDKEIDRTTLANDGAIDSQGNIIKLDYKTLGEIVFRGKASVKNGVFDFEFVVPRDIRIPAGNGRISFYSQKDGVLEDQAGSDQRIQIGGINENAPEDNTGPQIQLFMNDENFISGGVTDPSPILIAKLQDENGINTASGIGHDIAAILDGDEANPFILNDFYETEIDDYTRGTVNFKFRDLEPGLHTLSLKGWDVYNNSSTQEIQFTVAESSGLTLSNVLNYPNPFVSQTEFWFEHSSSVSDVLEVQVQVFTVSGKVVWTQNQTLSGKTSYTNEISWDGRDDFGDKLGKGVYVYKISAKSTLTNERVEKFEKLVIL